MAVAWKLARMLGAFRADAVADVENDSATFTLVPIAEFRVSLLEVMA